MNKLTGFLAVILLATAPAAFAETNAWQWQSTLVPKARVFAGPWSEYFQIEPALHRAGIPYSINFNVWWPADIPGTQDAVVVLGNTAAPHLGAARLARIGAFLEERYVGPGHLPHADLLLAREGQPFYRVTLGNARADGTPLGDDAIYRIASMSKAPGKRASGASR